MVYYIVNYVYDDFNLDKDINTYGKIIRAG